MAVHVHAADKRVVAWAASVMAMVSGSFRFEQRLVGST